MGPLVELVGSCGELALRTGLTRRGWDRRRLAGLSARQADEAAVRLGLHPCEIWADWFDGAEVGVGR